IPPCWTLSESRQVKCLCFCVKEREAATTCTSSVRARHERHPEKERGFLYLMGDCVSAVIPKTCTPWKAW
ncbi:hypothetical protein AOLI_G00327270, partial [Acnodon oligacanthus]